VGADFPDRLVCWRGQHSLGATRELAGSAHLREARATVLTHEDMRAANTFEKPEAVALASLPAQVSADTATVTIPKQAVVAVSIQIA